MSRSRILYRKRMKNFGDGGHSASSPATPHDHKPQRRDRHANPLASDKQLDQDSFLWSVADDWPEQVPVTSDEVDAIEAFLQEAIDDLLR